MNDPTHELDLHDRTVDEAILLFVEFYNRHVRSGRKTSLRIIHGYGSSGAGGKIQRKLRIFLQDAVDNLDWRPGEDLEGNPGVTIVFPRKTLPSHEDRLSAAILTFCSVPRTESKIAGEFRAHRAQDIKQAIRMLVRQGRLKTILKGHSETYLHQS
jgi:hypothetical protein